jgi:hypothetical protein
MKIETIVVEYMNLRRQENSGNWKNHINSRLNSNIDEEVRVDTSFFLFQ